MAKEYTGVQQFKDWLATKGDETFCFWHSAECALAQFGQQVLEEPRAMGGAMEVSVIDKFGEYALLASIPEFDDAHRKFREETEEGSERIPFKRILELMD